MKVDSSQASTIKKENYIITLIRSVQKIIEVIKRYILRNQSAIWRNHLDNFTTSTISAYSVKEI